jgi:hypothetical protein
MLQILSDKEKRIIHQTARQILNETGISVRSRIIYEMLQSFKHLRPCIYTPSGAESIHTLEHFM